MGKQLIKILKSLRKFVIEEAIHTDTHYKSLTSSTFKTQLRT
jgi:hypothetical protein